MQNALLDFQLPLSGSHGDGPRLRGCALHASFQLPLSGSPLPHGRSNHDLRTFQLPLSGSLRSVGGNAELHHVQHFQLPLSGSQCLRPRSRSCRKAHLSTPSLGITAVKGLTTKYEARDEKTFNSLSRDHRARFRDFRALRGFLPRHLFAQMIPKATI